ncbi:MAG: regulatory protein RecX [Clostridiaceae bacterium]|nr:regulatory protein RecX [Clostridiaceae bacterium]
MMRIYIDENYAFSVPKEDYIRLGLYEKEEITQDEIERIRQEVVLRAAREKATGYLMYRDRSEGEVIEKLINAGFDKDIAQEAASALKILGYIDDNRYARKYITDRLKNKAMSRKAIRFELERKGISSQIIEEALSETEVNEDEIALRTAKKKFGKYDVKDEKVRQKIMRYLCHKGFSVETGWKVIRILSGK